MYLVKTPRFIQNLFPNFLWSLPSTAKELYLTFDDGPIPEVTPWVLNLLEQFNAKATFFCVGDNISKYPDLFEQVKAKGHMIGNHTYNHLNGWATDNLAYFHNVRKCASKCKSTLFRPPYGKLRPKQAQFLQRHYKIVMWDILSGDFDPKIDQETCLNNVVENAKEGSVIVFHDSIKSYEKLSYVLPKTLDYFAKQGFTFSKIEGNAFDQKNPSLMKTA